MGEDNEVDTEFGDFGDEDWNVPNHFLEKGNLNDLIEATRRVQDQVEKTFVDIDSKIRSLIMADITAAGVLFSATLSIASTFGFNASQVHSPILPFLPISLFHLLGASAVLILLSLIALLWAYRPQPSYLDIGTGGLIALIEEHPKPNRSRYNILRSTIGSAVSAAAVVNHKSKVLKWAYYLTIGAAVFIAVTLAVFSLSLVFG